MLVELIVAAVLGALCLAIVLCVTKQLGEGRAFPVNVEFPVARIKKVLLRSLGRPSAERPRVVVSGPKVKPVVCQICLGRVKDGLEYAKCSCGKVFHPVCLLRTGACPYCGTAYFAETLTEERMVRPRPPDRSKTSRAAVSMIWEASTNRLCPLCGEGLPSGVDECACGALVVEEGQEFDCPSCGTRVPADRADCPNCRERFDLYASRVCPICGRTIPEDALVCECGALLEENCPECGASLGENDIFCAQCGTAFEFV